MMSFTRSFVIAFIAGLTLTSGAYGSDNIPSYAQGVITAVKTLVQECGVRVVVAPPNLQTPADYLALSHDGRVIAHLIDRPGIFAAKNPQGGNNHWIQYNMEWIGVFTPQGKVAGANRYTYGQAWQYNYYCRSQPVVPKAFDECIRKGFVMVLAGRICNS